MTYRHRERDAHRLTETDRDRHNKERQTERKGERERCAHLCPNHTAIAFQPWPPPQGGAG